MPYTNIPTADQIPYPSPDFLPVKALAAWASSITGNNEPNSILIDAENIKWTSKGRGESVFIDIGTELIAINRMLIEWDPALARTGTFKVEFIISPAVPDEQRGTIPETKGKTYEGVQDTSLFTLLEDDDKGAKARAIRIICYGNDGYNADDNNGISNVKLWSAL